MNAESIPDRKVAVLLWASVAVGAFFLMVLIAMTSGSVPRFDEWDTPGELLLASAQGNMSFNDDIFRQHGESRVIFAQLLTWVVVQLMGWNQHVMHMLNGLVIALSGVFFVRILRRTHTDTQGQPALLVAFSILVTALVFAPVQWRNYLYSGQIITLSIPCLLLVGLWVNGDAKRSVFGRYATAALCSVVATFSFANGMILWFLLWPAIPVLLANQKVRMPRDQWLPSLLYGAVGIASMVWFFVGYSKPGTHPSMMSSVSSPHRTLVFFATWLLGPLFPEEVLFWSVSGHKAVLRTMALTFLVAGLALLVWLFKNRRAFVNRAVLASAYPYLMLLAYSLASGFATAVGRVGFGSMFGNTSRYTTVAIPAHLGLLGLVTVANMKSVRPLREPWAFGVFSTCYGMAMLFSFPIGVVGAVQDKQRSDQAQLTLAARHVVPDDPLFVGMLYPDRAVATHRADVLETSGDLPALPSLKWIENAKITRLDHGSAVVTFDNDGAVRSVRGRVEGVDLEQDDFLVVLDEGGVHPVSVLWPPGEGRYLGSKPGTFSLTYISGEPFDPTLPRSYPVGLARSRTKTLYRLDRNDHR
jgi:hypothetical protein